MTTHALARARWWAAWLADYYAGRVGRSTSPAAEAALLRSLAVLRRLHRVHHATWRHNFSFFTGLPWDVLLGTFRRR